MSHKIALATRVCPHIQRSVRLIVLSSRLMQLDCCFLAFDLEYARWLDLHQRHINDLRSAADSRVSDNELCVLVDGVMAHYDEIFRLKSIGAKADVFHVLSGMWATPAERGFMWLGGFRSSELLKLLVGQLEPLTDQQLVGLCNLQQSSQQAEDALTQGMEALQQSLAETIASGSLGCTGMSNVADYMGQMAVAMSKLGMLENFLLQVAAIFKIVNNKDIPDIPEHISDDGKKFLKLCLRRDPSDRLLQAAAQLLEHPFVREYFATRVARTTVSKHLHPTGDRSVFLHREISRSQEIDSDIKHKAAYPTGLSQSRDNTHPRVNMSLPVSPCSSPLRQFGAGAYGNYFLSPPHPMAAGFGFDTYPIYPPKGTIGQARRSTETSSDIHLFKQQTPGGSPRAID